MGEDKWTLKRILEYEDYVECYDLSNFCSAPVLAVNFPQLYFTVWIQRNTYLVNLNLKQKIYMSWKVWRTYRILA